MSARNSWTTLPVLVAAPYLPLREPVEFCGWWVGPLEQFSGQWLDDSFEQLARRLLESFRDPGGRAIERPTVIARSKTGIDGIPLPAEEFDALRLSLGFAVIHQNPYWSTDSRHDGWRVATTDNADLWMQPLAPDGRIALGHGSRVEATAGGLNVTDDGFSVPPPLELHLPSRLSLDDELLEATYQVILRAQRDSEELPRRIRVALGWLLKSWQNTPSINWADRLVFLKIATEAITREESTIRSAKRLEAIFQGATRQEGEDIGLDDLLWSPGEPEVTRVWTSRGTQRSANVSQFVHWCCALGDARNAIVHGEAETALEYEQKGSPYGGPVVEVGDRIVREAICVLLGESGYPSVWRRELSRATFHALKRLQQEDSGGMG